MKALQQEIARREIELGALREAHRVLTGGASLSEFIGKGNRTPRTAAQKRKISIAMKRAWAARKAAAK